MRATYAAACRGSSAALAKAGGADYMCAMATVLAILIGVTLLAVVAVLVAGVLGMARGGEFNKRHGNTLMRYRVGLQFLAVVLIVLLVLVVRGGT